MVIGNTVTEQPGWVVVRPGLQGVQVGAKEREELRMFLKRRIKALQRN